DANDRPKELNESEKAVMSAFQLTMEQPTSGPIDSEFGYFVIQLTGINPARALTLDEAKPKLMTQLKEERTEETLGLKGTEARNKIDAELKGGKSFADAAKAAGLQAETVPAFSMTQPPKNLAEPGMRDML